MSTTSAIKRAGSTQEPHSPSYAEDSAVGFRKESIQGGMDIRTILRTTITCRYVITRALVLHNSLCG